MKPQEYQCKVISFRMLTPTVFELAFEPHQTLPFKAGQFASIIIPGAGPKGRDLRRAYSVASPPENSTIELCVKVVEDGPGTQFLYQLRPGDSFRAIAPYGDFVYQPNVERHACFIATGTGIAPFRAMLLSKEYSICPPLTSICMLGVRTVDELLYREELKNIPGLTYLEAVSQPDVTWNGYRGRVTDYLKSLTQDHPWMETEFYLCGNGQMINEVKLFLIEKGISKDSIHQEIYYK